MIFYYPLLIHDDDGYWGEFPDVEGCHAQGDSIDEIIEDLEDIPCKNRGTSCPDQLAKALKIYKKYVLNK